MDNKEYETIITKLARIETLIESYKDTQIKADSAYNLSTQNKKDIDEIEDKIKWLSRTIGVSIIGLVISVIVYVIKLM